MLNPEQSTFLKIVSYYFTVTILWILTLLVNSQLKLSRGDIPLINNYSNYFGFILLSELMCKICYVPDHYGLIIITLSTVIWRVLSQLDEFHMIFGNLYGLDISIIIFIIIIGFIILIHQLVYYEHTRYKIFLRLGLELINMCTLVALSEGSDIITMHRWQIFYFIVVLLPEKKYYIVYNILIGMIISEINSYGLQPPY